MLLKYLYLPKFQDASKDKKLKAIIEEECGTLDSGQRCQVRDEDGTILSKISMKYYLYMIS